MISGEWLRAFAVLGMAWFVIRFLLVAAAIALREGSGAAGRWLRTLEERGYFLTTCRSGEVFSRGMHRLGAGLLRLKGRGPAGSLTFALVAATFLFLWSLPLSQLHQARATYDSARSQLADPEAARMAPLTFCAVEHALREIERQTGGPILRVPEGFRVYPLDEAARTRLEAVYPRFSVDLYLRELLAGNKLSDDPRDLRPELRSHPRFADGIRRLTRDGRVDPALADFVVHSPENAALADDILAFCGGERLAANRTFEPIRPRGDYAVAVERFRLGAIALLDDPLIRDSYDLFQQRSAEMQLLLSLLYSLAAGFLLLLSLKLAIRLCRWTRPQLGLTNNGLRVAFSVPAFVLVAFLFIGFNSAFRVAAPLAVGFVATRSPAGSVEQDYRRRAAYFIDRVGRLTRQTCQDIGPRSPLSPGCRLADAYLEPWDPRRGTFDFNAAVPLQRAGGRPLPDAFVTMAQDGLLNLVVAAGTLEDEPGVSDGSDFWGGMKSSPAALLMLAPFILVFLAAVGLLMLVDARRVLAKRLARGDL